MTTYTAERKAEFASLSRGVPYAEQAKRFLNVFWTHKDIDFANKPDAREAVWNYTKQFVALDTTKKDSGTELDEFQAHRRGAASDGRGARSKSPPKPFRRTRRGRERSGETVPRMMTSP